MAAIGTTFIHTYGYTSINGTIWATSGPTTYYPPPSDYKTVYAEQFTALAKQRKREARAERDRQIIRDIARLQARTAQDAIRDRQRFARVAGKRWTAAQRARLRRFA